MIINNSVTVLAFYAKMQLTQSSHLKLFHDHMGHLVYNHNAVILIRVNKESTIKLLQYVLA